ncbi:MAG: glycosyltransferase family 1 protein [Candidatus Marinimicrobia bacterium]|nr:glycosyltransferase family 1 protein [Candidatus Neomarinimicrobiota bacterium]|tara:strand:- start:5602 stop:6774 length:1173 start_codon:yes stop_codon:yes gene_type:complete
MRKNKIIRVTTVPVSLSKLLEGQLSFINRYYQVIAISSGGDILDTLAKTEKIKAYSVDMTRKITPLKDLKSLFRIYRIFKKEKPLIVHSHTPKAGTLSMIAAKLAGIKIRMHTVAGLPLLEKEGFKRKVLNLVEKITYYCATNVYPNSLNMVKIITDQKFCKNSKLKVIANGSSNGIDLEYFDSTLFNSKETLVTRDAVGVKKDDFVFIFIGRLVRDKGLNELIDAFNNINKEYNNVKLLLLGREESDLDPISSKSLETINSNKHIIHLGYKKDVRPYLNISNVLVFPSYREGFPNTVMQACAMNLPSIVTDINGCNEIIKNNYNGVIIPPKDKDSLYLAMKKIINDPKSVLKEFSKNSRSRMKKYDRKIVWNELLSEYKKLEKEIGDIL